MSSTRIDIHLKAPRAAVYRALTDAEAIAAWRVPTGMTSHVHAFDPREGGAFRISLTYEDATEVGKSVAHTDTYHGHFVKLVPNEQVIEELEFETAEPDLMGKMVITYTLSDAPDGTILQAVHAGLPSALSPIDNELGWRISLGKLAELVEGSGGHERE